MGVSLLPTKLDVIENPKKLKLVELKAPQFTALSEWSQQISLEVINTTYASQISMTPIKDSLFIENKNLLYINLMVAHQDNDEAENVKKFVQSYQSDEVNEAANKIFSGSDVKGW